MGWGRMLLLGDLGQQLDLQDQKQEIDSLKRELRSASAGRASGGLDRRVAQLEQENDELRLYLAALIRHLTAKGVVNAIDLRGIVQAIDAEDGQVDGSYEGEIL